MNERLSVIIVSQHASARFGGEAALPLHYFRVLRQRDIDVRLVVHARTRDELSSIFPGETRIHYIEDTWFHRLMSRISNRLPSRIGPATAGFAGGLATQFAQRRLVRKLIHTEGIDVVHQPMPVSPREPSMLYGFGVPVIIGPMNGGIDFPPGFDRYQSATVSWLLGAGRSLSDLMNRLMPGKLRSDVLLVANDRTRRSLPAGVKGRIVELVENGVDLALWTNRDIDDEPDGNPEVRFLFMGRLVGWKAVDLLLQAFKKAAIRASMSLTIVGEGNERAALQNICRDCDLLAEVPNQPGKVFFAGWKPQADCSQILRRSNALVLPSLMECGGAVVLEAMAAGRPVIATDWGGPADYLDESCGVLVKPLSEKQFVNDLANAMVALAHSRDLRLSMGRAGRQKVAKLFDWNIKVDRMTEIYREAINANRTGRRP